MPAMEIFSHAIRYLKDHCLGTIDDRGFLPNTKDIKFILTVPAIWNDRSKEFMREAAIKVSFKNFFYLFHEIRKHKIHYICASL